MGFFQYEKDDQGLMEDKITYRNKEGEDKEKTNVTGTVGTVTFEGVDTIRVIH